MNRIAALFFCCLLCPSSGLGVNAFQKDGGAAQSVEKTYPRHMNFPSVTFKELKDGDVKQEQFNVEGYVADVYECPPCPRGAMCKPCIPDYMDITETKDPSKNPAPPEERLRVFVKNPTQFEKGKRYLLSVKIAGRRKAGQRVEQVELIGYDAAEDVDKK
jgi:hypothetical protein